MDRGYIRLWRKLRDTDLLKNHALFTFKVWCLLRASWKGHTVWIGNEEVELSAGEFIAGRKTICEALALSEKKARNVVEASVKSRFIRASKRASTYTIYSVVNWDVYQSDPNEKGQHLGQQKGQLRASIGANEGPTKGHKEEVKEGKKGKREEGEEEDQTLLADADKPRRPRTRKPPREKTPVPPLIEALRLGLGRYPKREQWDAIIAQANGQRVNMDALTRHAAEWAANGWNPSNYLGALRYHFEQEKTAPREEDIQDSIRAAVASNPFLRAAKGMG